MKRPPKTSRRRVDQQVGKKITREMAVSALSASELSAILGVPADTLERYCRGEQRVAPNHLYELSRVFEIPIIDFFADAPRPLLH